MVWLLPFLGGKQSNCQTEILRGRCSRRPVFECAYWQVTNIWGAGEKAGEAAAPVT